MAVNFHTSWYTYRPDPWDGLRATTAVRGSHAGWHDLVTQVADGHVRYYVDGALKADHTVDDRGNPVDPRQDMSLNYNLWFIDLAGHAADTSVYEQQVDWTYYAKNEVVAPAEASASAATLRSGGTAFRDTLAAGSECTPPPTTPPATPPTTPPTTPPADCSAVADWDWSTVYLEGQRAKHNGRLWQANWWTQGSEPGPTAQWRDLGACS